MQHHFKRRGGTRQTVTNLARMAAALVVVAVSLALAAPAAGAQGPATSGTTAGGTTAGGTTAGGTTAEGTTTGGAPAEVQLAFVGDIMLALRVAGLIGQKGTDYPWQHVAPVLQKADLAVGNLECAVGTTGQPEKGKEYTFRAPPLAADGLARAGIDVVGLGNNHALDYGRECFLETLDNLKRVKVAYVGGGRNLEEAARPYIADLKGIKVGILGVCLHLPKGWGATEKVSGLFSGFDTNRLYKAIRDLGSRVDWTVVFVHWGNERADHPEKWHQTLAQRMLEAGADLVIGHHPHVWQGIDRRDRSLIAYSLGNFIFTIRPEFPQQQQTGILLVTLTRDRIREVRVIPCHIPRAGETVLAQGELAARILNRIDRVSAPFDTYMTADGRVERAAFADVRDHWAREDIGALAARGIITGDDTGRYRPEDPTTLAGLTTLLVRTLGLPDAPAVALPADLKDHWAAPHLRAALAAGLISQGETVPPAVNAPVPRWKTAHMLAAAMAAGGRPLPPVDSLPGYPDLGSTPRPALDAIARVTAAGLMQGYPDGRFGPADSLTRGQTACILLRLLRRLEQPQGTAGAGPGQGTATGGSGQGGPP
ncbi:MAG: CapA family protein [Bacillota bacterium]